MARQVKINPRRNAEKIIRNIQRNLNGIGYVWKGPRHQQNPETRRFERAPADQQPENRAEDWLMLGQYMRVIAQDAAHLAAYADEKVRELAE